MEASLPKVRKHRTKWAAVAIVVALAFFTIWVLGNFGTPARTAVEPVLPIETTTPVNQ